MRRIARVVPWTLVLALTLVAYVVAQPGAPTASAYPTAMENRNVATAFSTECVWDQTCWWSGGVGYCIPDTDLSEGCWVDLTGSCLGCME